MCSFTGRRALVLAVLSVNVFMVCCAYNNVTTFGKTTIASLPVIELKTQDNLEYTYNPVPSKTLRFKVKAGNDAHIILSAVPSPSEAEPVVEVFIGGWGNSKSAIRVNRTKPDKDTQDTPKILSGDEFRGFWVSFDNNVVAAGREGDDGNPFVKYASPQPLNISYYGLCTGYGSHGEWIIEDERIFTQNSLEYVYRPIPKLALDIHVRAPHNAHIALSNGPRDSDPMYEILLGGWENSASVIRYRKEKPDKVRVDTASILSPSEHRRFIISWNNGIIKVIHKGRTLLEWTDPSPFAVTHFGVRTAWGSQGFWSIQFVDSKNIDTATPPAPIGFEGGPPVASGPVTWIPASGGTIPPGAVMGGYDNENIYVGRAHHEGALIPGKVLSSHGVCYVPWGGGEHGKPDYEILTGSGVHWVQSVDGQLPPGAVPGGNSEDGETLYIGRATHEGTQTVGKVQPSHKVCYIPFGGQELSYPEYEVLVSS